MGTSAVGLSSAAALGRTLGLTWWPSDDPFVRTWLRAMGWAFIALSALNVWYLVERGVRGIVVVGIFTAAGAMSWVTRLPVAVRACASALALGTAPLVVLGLPGGAVWVSVALPVGVLLALGFRSLAATLIAGLSSLTMFFSALVNHGAGPFGHSLIIPSDASNMMTTDSWQVAVGVPFIVAMGMGIAQLVRAGHRESNDIQARTWHVLDAMTSTTHHETDLQRAAALMLDTLCDSRWPVGHLWWSDGDAFICSGTWSSLTDTVPGFREAIEDQAVLPSEASAMVARVQARQPAWATWSAGSDGPIGAAATPVRRKVMMDGRLGSMLMCPVMAGPDVVAVIEICGYPSYPHTPPETLLLRTAASLLSRVAEREGAVASLLSRVAEREGAVAAARSQAQLANATLSVFPDGVLVVDPRSGEVRDHNDKAAELLTERASATIVGARAEDLLPGLAESLAGCVDTAVLHLGGTQLEVKRAAADDSSGEDLLFIRDLTVRAAAESRLEANSDRYRAMTASAKVGILELDRTDRVSFANTAGAALFGLDEHTIVGRSFVDIVPFGQTLLAEATRAGAPTWSTGDIHAAGRRVPAMASAVPTLVRGRRAGAIVTIADTSQVAKQTAFSARQEHARELNDTVAQHLVEALYLLEEGDVQAAARATSSALTSARDTIATLLAGAPLTESTLLRQHAATADLLAP